MSVLTTFVEETFMLTTGIGEMKVAEAIFLSAVQSAAKTLSEPAHANKTALVRSVLSVAYNGQNIIKMCAHLPRDSNAEKYARDLRLLAYEIDCLVCPMPTD